MLFLQRRIAADFRDHLARRTIDQLSFLKRDSVGSLGQSITGVKRLTFKVAIFIGDCPAGLAIDLLGGLK